MKWVKVGISSLLAVSVLLGATGIVEAKSSKSSYKYTNPYHGPTYKVSGYTKKNGTYVSPYDRTKANHTKTDNLRYRGK